MYNASAGSFQFTLRSRVEKPEESAWRSVESVDEVAAADVAILLCDVWDDHWCRSAARRCDTLAQRMAVVVDAARARGAQIIHAPSDCMDFYEGTPQRRRMQEAPAAPVPQEAAALMEPPLPIDDSDGGCDDEPRCREHRAWTRQHPAITIAPDDGISDSGTEVYNLLRQQGRGTLVVMGVHTNMCVLRRSFGLRAMRSRGVRCLLARDLTDAMYNPRRAPFVTHEQGTALVIEHIERYLCPTILSADLCR